MTVDTAEADAFRSLVVQDFDGIAGMAPTLDAHERPIRLYVERRIDEQQADVVRRIFQI